MLLRIDVSHISSLFDVEQLVGPHHHLVHLKGAIVLIESESLFCFDNSVVTPLHSLMTFANPCHLGHLTKALPSEAARCPHLHAELFVGRLDCFLLCVQSGEAIPSHSLLIKVSHTHLGLTIQVGLLDTLVSFVFTDVPSRVSVTVSSAP